MSSGKTGSVAKKTPSAKPKKKEAARSIDKADKEYKQNNPAKRARTTSKGSSSSSSNGGLREYPNPYTKVGKEIPKTKGYYNVKLKWATLNPYVVHKLTQIVDTEAIAVDCRKKILAHLTTHDVGIHDKHGNPVAVEPQFGLRLQRYFKQFVRDVYRCVLIYGVAPVTMVQDESGYQFPKAAKPGTFVIQTAYCAEDEKQYYRVIRPIYFCARPDKLKYYEKLENFSFPMPFESAYGGVTHGGLEMDLKPHPAAGQDITSSLVKDMGWFIDDQLCVLDCFDSSPSALGELRSPLIGLIKPHNVANCLGDVMLRAEYKMLIPTYLLEPKVQNNVDDRSKYNEPAFSVGGPAAEHGLDMSDRVERERINAKNVLTMGMHNILSEVPDITRLTPQQVIQIKAQQRELEKRTTSGPLTDSSAAGGEIMKNYYRKLAEDAAKGEVEGKVRYCPEGYAFSGANKHPEAKAGGRYFDAKEDYSRMICSSFGVPISVIYTLAKESAGVHEEQTKIFQRTVSNKCIEFNNLLTQIFRESFSGEGSKKFPRMMSIKSVSEDYGFIDAENNRNPDRYLQAAGMAAGKNMHNPMGMMGAHGSTRTIPEMTPRYAALPMPSDETIKHVMQTQKDESKPASPVTGDQPSDKEKEEERPKAPAEAFEKDDEYDEKPLKEKFSGAAVEPLAVASRMRLREELMNTNLMIHKSKGRAVLEHGGVKRKRHSSGDGKDGGSDGEEDCDVSEFTICLDPVIYHSSEGLLETAKAGAISVERYQKLLCEGNGITQSAGYGGIDGARKNANLFSIMELAEINMTNEADKEGKSRGHEKDMFKMTEKKEKDTMAAEHKFAKENPPGGASKSGGGSKSSGGSKKK